MHLERAYCVWSILWLYRACSIIGDFNNRNKCLTVLLLKLAISALINLEHVLILSHTLRVRGWFDFFSITAILGHLVYTYRRIV